MSPEEKIARLEERLAWFERHATEQDKAMLELTERVERLRKELSVLRDRAVSSGREGGELPAEERPPHY